MIRRQAQLRQRLEEVNQLLKEKYLQLEKVAIAIKALQLECRTTSRQSFWAVLGHFVLRMCKNCYFAPDVFTL